MGIYHEETIRRVRGMEQGIPHRKDLIVLQEECQKCHPRTTTPASDTRMNPNIFQKQVSNLKIQKEIKECLEQQDEEQKMLAQKWKKKEKKVFRLICIMSETKKFKRLSSMKAVITFGEMVGN